MTAARSDHPPDHPSDKGSVLEDATAVALRTVLQIAEVVNCATDEQDLIERALDAIVTYTRFPCCGLFRLDASGQWLDMVAHRNVSREVYDKAKRLPVEGSLTGLAVVRQSVVTSGDLAQDPRLEPSTREALAKEGYMEVASVPLHYGNRAFGAVNFIYRAQGALSHCDREILLGIGRTIAIALANRVAEAERTALAAQLRRSEQIERLGLLAGGIAHDFNNLLTGILGTVSLSRHLVKERAQPDVVLPLLDDAEKAVRRSAGLVRQLLTFSRGGAPVLRTTGGFGALVRESAEFSAHGSSVRLDFAIAPDLPAMEIDTGQISQMVQNLVLNAVQASPGGATVSIAVDRLAARDQGDPRPWVRVQVQDHGSGIAPEHLPRLFEPYFSTKRNGNGLGLATVQSIVGRHGGRVEADSEPGRGATFSVYLPGSLKAAPVAARLDPGSAVGPRGGRALVMDDNPTILHLARALLVDQGYEVETAATGEAALALCAEGRDSGRAFDLAVLDLTVPGGMGGQEALPKLRALFPSIACVVASGYSDEDVLARFAEHGFDAVLPKPFTREQFIHAISDARDRRRP